MSLLAKSLSTAAFVKEILEILIQCEEETFNAFTMLFLMGKKVSEHISVTFPIKYCSLNKNKYVTFKLFSHILTRT